MDSSNSHTSLDPTSPSDSDLASGETVGEYEIEGKIGSGGFGDVYKAVHPLIGKIVAIKVLHRRYSAQPEMVSRFIAEARAVNQIRHRNIIDIFAFGQLEDGRHYYVMEFLDGTTLEDHLENHGPMSLPEAIPVLRKLARALDAAHAKGIAHRDLKPENVYMVPDDEGGYEPKLLDFGIAKLLVDEMPEKQHKTRTGAPIGTPQYMSPEQCRGRGVDHRTDIYGFGIMAYRMFTGALPFDGEDYMDVLLAQIQQEAAPPSSVNPSLPGTVDDAIEWMLQKDPADRPPTLFTAVRGLEAAAESAGIALPRAPSVVGLPVMADPGAPRGAPLSSSTFDGDGDDGYIPLLSSGRARSEPLPRSALMTEARAHAAAERSRPSASQDASPWPDEAAERGVSLAQTLASEPSPAARAGTRPRAASHSERLQHQARAGARAGAPVRDSEAITAEVEAVTADVAEPAPRPRRRLVTVAVVVCGLAGAIAAGVAVNRLLSPSRPDSRQALRGAGGAGEETPPAAESAGGVQGGPAGGAETAGDEVDDGDTRAAPAPDSDPDGAGSPATEDRYVTVTIDGPPEGTEVYGPQGLLGVAPGKIQLMRGTEPVLLTFKAAELSPETREVVPSDDRAIRVEFEPKPRSRPASRPGRAAPPKSRRTHRGRDTIEDPFR